MHIYSNTIAFKAPAVLLNKFCKGELIISLYEYIIESKIKYIYIYIYNSALYLVIKMFCPLQTKGNSCVIDVCVVIPLTHYSRVKVYLHVQIYYSQGRRAGETTGV